VRLIVSSVLGAVVVGWLLKSDKMWLSKARYRTPRAVMAVPPTRLWIPMLVRPAAQRERFLTYIRVTFSAFIAGSKVKMLIIRQETIHARLNPACFRRNKTPYVAGHVAARMKIPVRISR